MNCKDFQHWLLTRDVFTDKENPDALVHLKTCTVCKNLYTIDERLEETIKAAFGQKEIPKKLWDQIDLSLDHAKNFIRHKPLKITGLVAGFVLVVAVAFMLFSNRPFRYQNLQQLSEEAIDRHLKGEMAPSFSAEDIEQAVVMLSKELKFKVVLPDLKDQGYVLLGGRLCALGKCKIAYLFYEKYNRICSLFIMDYGYIDFQMADGSRFSNDIKGCHTDIWKEKGQVYAMVY